MHAHVCMDIPVSGPFPAVPTHSSHHVQDTEPVWVVLGCFQGLGSQKASQTCQIQPDFALVLVEVL